MAHEPTNVRMMLRDMFCADINIIMDGNLSPCCRNATSRYLNVTWRLPANALAYLNTYYRHATYRRDIPFAIADIYRRLIRWHRRRVCQFITYSSTMVSHYIRINRGRTRRRHFTAPRPGRTTRISVTPVLASYLAS